MAISRTVLVSLMVLAAAGCASRANEPIVDMRGVDPMQYRQDLAECYSLADQVAVGHKAGQGAVGGAVVGGALGAILGRDTSAGEGAAAGAVLGASRGTADGLRERQGVVRNCLRHRGYAVYN